MKTIYVVRHAKSSWGDLTLSDFDRPLNDRGQRNAPEMAQRLLIRQSSIDLFITSTAKRALQTAMHFISVYGRPVEELILRDELYHAPATTYKEIILGTPDTYSSIALFGHNPGITAFVNQLTSTQIDDMPTCAVFAVELDCERWADFTDSSKNFLFFDRPRDAGF